MSVAVASPSDETRNHGSAQFGASTVTTQATGGSIAGHENLGKRRRVPVGANQSVAARVSTAGVRTRMQPRKRIR